MTDLQTASYLLINGFHWYLYRRLLTLFLGQRRVGCPAEAAGYLCAYVLNSLCFLLVGVPLLNLASSLLPLLLLLGAGGPQENPRYGQPMHNPKVVFNEDVLPLGAALLTAGAMHRLER